MPPKVISTSQINLYRNCPRSYYLKYVAGIKTDIPAPQLEFGSKIHSMISSGNFKSDDPREKEMLERAERFLTTLPQGGIFETSYEDKNNRARFYGDVCGHRAVGIFDIFWEPPDEPMGTDWKTGSLRKSHTDSYEIQGYFLNELYKQRYDTPLKRLPFKFLADDQVYQPELLFDAKENLKTEKRIIKALKSIEEGKFDRKCSGLCAWCEYSCVCPMEEV